MCVITKNKPGAITHALKIKWHPIIMRRDYEEIPFELVTCFYCENIFVKSIPNETLEWEHLDDDVDNSVIENMVWAHKFCNNKKKNDFDMKSTAMEKYQRKV